MFVSDVELASCSNCKFATVYIPYWTYPWATPYCSKGNGLCGVDRICSDWEQIGRLSR